MILIKNEKNKKKQLIHKMNIASKIIPEADLKNIYNYIGFCWMRNTGDRRLTCAVVYIATTSCRCFPVPRRTGWAAKQERTYGGDLSPVLQDPSVGQCRCREGQYKSLSLILMNGHVDETPEVVCLFSVWSLPDNQYDKPNHGPPSHAG